MSKRSYWNKKGKEKRRVKYDIKNIHWNGREGVVSSCARGDCGPNDPYVQIIFDKKPDGTEMKWHVLWDVPSHCLSLIRKGK